MITSITLENYRSFGERQTVPLQPITVLVGANNSGKSCFASLSDTVRRWLTADSFSDPFLFHRPLVGDRRLAIGWTTTSGSSVQTTAAAVGASPVGVDEMVRAATRNGGFDVWSYSAQGGFRRQTSGQGTSLGARWLPLSGLQFISTVPDCVELFEDVAGPWLGSRLVRLSVEALRRDAKVVASPTLTSDGSEMAAVAGYWRTADIERSNRLDEFVRRSLPEIRHVIVKPGDGTQRLWVQQTDGEQFDATHVSDGVLYFIGLAMHIIDAPPGSLIFIEEPEQSIHPRRLHDIVEQLRRVADESKCQFVIATHSPILLNEFRDEPEAVVLFQRGEKGTRVRTLAEVPELVAALDKAYPGDLLATGFFNDAA